MSAVAAAVVGGSMLAGGVAVAGLSVGATAALAAGGTALAAGAAQSSAQRETNRAREAQTQAARELAGSSDYAAELADRLGRERLDFERQQYDELSPLARRISEGQIAAQEEQLRQGRDYYDYMTSTFRPLEQGLVQQVRDFNTEAYRERLANQAAEDAARAFGNVQGQTTRGLARMGVAPGSGAAGAQLNQNAIALASQRTGAMTGARTRAEDIGYARQLDAIGIGRGLPGASTAAYGASVGAGSAGLNTAMAPGSQLSGAMGSAASTMLAGTGQRIGGYSTLYSGTSDMARTALENQYGLQGAMLGTAGTLGARFIS